MIETKIRHSYVEKFIQKPLIDLDKLTILHYLYKDLEAPLHKKQQYIITIMLVQIALDTHELVPSNGSNDMSETEKQLSVLAGDYYSGLYYYLLSEIEDIEMIQILATAIQQINEQKMKLFYGNVDSIDELVDTIKDIESLLFTHVANEMNENHALIPIIKELLFINRLYKEKESVLQHKFSYLENIVNKNELNHGGSSTLSIIEVEIDYSKQQLSKLLLHLPYHFVSFKNIIRNRIELSYKTSVAEEG